MQQEWVVYAKPPFGGPEHVLHYLARYTHRVAISILARTFARRKEIAIRSALGANRSRIIQQLLSESLIISLCGGALGLMAAHFGIELLLKFFADKLPRMGDIGLNGPVLAFTFALSIATGILSGLLPAWGMTKGDVNDALKQGLGRTDADSGSSKTRSALVVIEVRCLSYCLSELDSWSGASGSCKPLTPVSTSTMF